MTDPDERAEPSRSSNNRTFALSVVSDKVQAGGNMPSTFDLHAREVADAHWSVLLNCHEAALCTDKHLIDIYHGDRSRHEREFPAYFWDWMYYLRENGYEDYDRELYLLASRPQHTRTRAVCYVNGVKFVSTKRDEGSATQNNGVMVEGPPPENLPYYGVVDSMHELTYGEGLTVVLFKCKWFDSNPANRPITNCLDRGMLSLDTDTYWYADDPFIRQHRQSKCFTSQIRLKVLRGKWFNMCRSVVYIRKQHCEVRTSLTTSHIWIINPTKHFRKITIPPSNRLTKPQKCRITTT